ncbi:MAG: GGDEF domain-containing protein, partial [Phycisphaerales bacterium]|nr:GGDEF domain-containing protein [Phycisphaerales bacterium]
PRYATAQAPPAQSPPASPHSAPPPSLPRPHTPQRVDEAALLQALLAGRDVLLPALEVIRARTGAADVYFQPASAGTETAEPPRTSPEPFSCTVEHRGKAFGRLVSASLPPDVMADHAEVLAHWLALRDQQDQLRAAAFSDELTGAYNRRYFERYLSAALDLAKEQRQPVSVLFFDIDDFKQYNDRYGHAAGDEILRQTVMLLRSVIRPTDRVCRIGGDEFAVVFHDPAGPRDPSAAASAKGISSIRDIAERFQRQVCEHRFPKLAEDAPGALTISAGLACFPWDGRTVGELLRRADELALQSKRQGKNALTLGRDVQRECDNC